MQEELEQVKEIFPEAQLKEIRMRKDCAPFELWIEFKKKFNCNDCSEIVYRLEKRLDTYELYNRPKDTNCHANIRIGSDTKDFSKILDVLKALKALEG